MSEAVSSLSEAKQIFSIIHSVYKNVLDIYTVSHSWHFEQVLNLYRKLSIIHVLKHQPEANHKSQCPKDRSLRAAS